jgi:hypothetical protein
MTASDSDRAQVLNIVDAAKSPGDFILLLAPALRELVAEGVLVATDIRRPSKVRVGRTNVFTYYTRSPK